ncbi:MAG: hypothetical protein U5P41_07420 [Gammaproteobacteria bacterium]|nr:hypothetical protein [Gammaproteobacteria bacterium]
MNGVTGSRRHRARIDAFRILVHEIAQVTAPVTAVANPGELDLLMTGAVVDELERPGGYLRPRWQAMDAAVMCRGLLDTDARELRSVHGWTVQSDADYVARRAGWLNDYGSESRCRRRSGRCARRPGVAHSDEEYQAAKPEEGSEPAPGAVCIAGGKLHDLADSLETILGGNAAAGIYQRGGALAEISTIPQGNHKELKRPDDAHVIVIPPAPRLRELGTRYGAWQRYDARSKKWRFVDCPRDVAETLALRGSWRLPVLTAVLGAPTVAPDGRLLNQAGYNPEGGVYLHIGKWRKTKGKPTRDDAVAARETLEDLISEFPFVDGPSRAVWLAALLTGLVRWSLPTAPFFGFDAPVMGSGKTLLANLVGVLINGHKPAALTKPKDETEMRKVVLAALVEGDPVLLIDNIEYPLGGAELCSIATSETYSDRLLGQSRNVTVRTAVTVMMTGNNLTIRGDLSTRVLSARLDPGVEHPEEREFERSDITAYALDKRQELVNAALTILLAHHRAKQPDAGLKPFGRFEQWSLRVRSALVWAGCEDPCETRSRVEGIDPEREMHRELLENWWLVYGATEVTTQQMVADCSDELNKSNDKYVALRDALELIAKDGGKINTRRLGNRFSRWEARVFNGLRIVRGKLSSGRQHWRLEQLSSGLVGFSGLHSTGSENCHKSDKHGGSA